MKGLQNERYEWKRTQRRWRGGWWLALCVVWMCVVGSRSAEAKPGHLARWSLWEGKASFWVMGQYRPRLEVYQNRDFRVYSPDTPGGVVPKDSVFISHRARLTVGASMWERVKVVLQVQDVRKWGSETNTLGDFSADGFDLHQGFAELGLVDALWLKIGRMELNYNTQRLIGAVAWTQQARSFDGVLLKWEPKAVQLHAGYFHLSEQGAVEDDSHLALLWFRWRSLRAFQPSLFYIFDHHAPVNRLRHTFGTHIDGRIAGFRYTGEFFLQLGSQGTDPAVQDLMAYLLAFSAAYTLPVPTRPTFKVWAEFLSGDADLSDTTVRVFDTLFATNHKFYGLADLFLNIPAHTGGRGLMDLGGAFQLSPARGLFVVAAFHYLRLFTPTTDASQQHVQELGPEVDIVAKYVMFQGHVVFAAGYSFLVPLAAFQALGKGNQVEHWAFVQTDVKF